MIDPRRPYSACPYIQHHTLPSLLDSLAAKLMTYSLGAKLTGSLYHFYEGLWYERARAHPRPTSNHLAITKITLYLSDFVVAHRGFWNRHYVLLVVPCQNIPNLFKMLPARNSALPVSEQKWTNTETCPTFQRQDDLFMFMIDVYTRTLYS